MKAPHIRPTLIEIRVLQGFFTRPTHITDPNPKGFSRCEKRQGFFKTIYAVKNHLGFKINLYGFCIA
jgi:hypothetical protein